MNPSKPNSKKRCWTLLLRDIKKTNAKESDVLPSFRKRYTSARKLAFRTPTAYELNQIAGRSSREGGILCIDVRFTGPQPIEGPADLLCNLLQASFVAAQPVQLGRGRKRKNRGGISAPQPPSFASSTNDGSRTAGSTSAAATSSFFSSDSNSGRSTSAETVSSTSTDASSTSCRGTPNACAAASAYPTKSLSQHLPTSWQEPETCRGGGGGVFSALRSAFGSASGRGFGGGVGRARGGDGPKAVCVSPTPSRLGRSSSGMIIDKDGLPAWDEVVRTVDTPPTSSCSPAMDERHPLSDNSMGAAAAADSANVNTTAAATFTGLALSAPGLAAGGSYYEYAATVGAIRGTEDDLWGVIPDETDAPTLDRHSSSCWALHPVHVGTAVVANDGDKADDSGAGAQPDQRRISAAPAIEVAPQAEGRDVSFDWREEECDFDGRPVQSPAPSEKIAPLDSKHSFTFHGLEPAALGYELRDFSVRAQFFINATGSAVAERVSSLCRVDASGLVHAMVSFPSIQEIWPAAYGMSSITAIEANMTVEIRSSDEKFVRTGPTLKVMYQRQLPSTATSTAMDED